jgi:hypothetical protein
MPLASMAIGAGTSILGGILGSKAAGQAAKQQGAAATNAANMALTTGQQALGTQAGATQQATQLAQPYTTAGAGAMGQLSSMLAPGGSLSKTWDQSFQAPSAADAAATPGYQFALQQGQQALQRSAAAKGGLLSSGALKSLDQYSQGLASQTYQQTYNNAFSNYQQNYLQFLNNQQNQYKMLSGVAGMGQQTSADLSRMLQAGAENTGRVGYGMSGQYGQDITNAGAAAAQGTLGQANAWSGMLGGLAKAGMGGLDMRANTGSWTNFGDTPSSSPYAPTGAADWSALPAESSQYFNPGATSQLSTMAAPNFSTDWMQQVGAG